MAFIDHINLRIPENDIQKALEFYRGTLGFETWKLEEYRNDERTSFFFKIGENALLNIRPKSNFQRPEGRNYDHFCINVDKYINILETELESKNYKILRKGEPLGSQGRAPALYVEDPFGYVLELKKSS